MLLCLSLASTHESIGKYAECCARENGLRLTDLTLHKKRNQAKHFLQDCTRLAGVNCTPFVRSHALSSLKSQICLKPAMYMCSTGRWGHSF